jgi:hypothetical protein
VKYWQTTLAILAALSASPALADDFKTFDGKEYKNATVTRVEPDGIVIRFSGGIVTLPFADLPEVGGIVFFRKAVFEGPVSFVAADIASNFEADGTKFQNKETGASFNRVGTAFHETIRDC